MKKGNDTINKGRRENASHTNKILYMRKKI